jgi:hypothetical protein
VNQFQFGAQTITTQVYVMAPRAVAARAPYVDVTAAMSDHATSRAVRLKVIPAATGGAAEISDDPFAGVEV